MSFNHQSAYVGPFAISLGMGKPGDIQRFRYPVPVKNLDAHLKSKIFVVAGRLNLSWSSGPEFDTELRAGGSFTEDATEGRPLMLNEELIVRSQGDSRYVSIAPIGLEQRIGMRRVLLQRGERIEVQRYDLAITAESDNTVLRDGKKMPPGPRIYYGRTRGIELESNGPVNCAVFTILH